MVLCYGVGIAIAYVLAQINHLEPYKLLNAIGIIYGLVGVLILTEFVVSNQRLRHFVVDWIAGIIIWAHSIVPFAIAITSIILVLWDRKTFPSAPILGTFAMSFAIYSILPTLMIDFYVLNPKSSEAKDPIARSRFFGTFLVVTGLVVQLVAAVLDIQKSGASSNSL